MKTFKLRLARIARNLFRSNFTRAFLSSYRWYRKWHGGRWEYRWLDSCASFAWVDVSLNEYLSMRHHSLSSSGMLSVENWPTKEGFEMTSTTGIALIAWREMDDGAWIYYDIDSSTGKHITEYQKYRHGISVFPVYGACDPSADALLEKAIGEFNRTLLLASLGGEKS